MPDLSWPHVTVAIEHEGDHHRRDRQQWQRDARTRERLRENGWRVLLLTADDVLRRPGEVVARVAAALREPGVTWRAGRDVVSGVRSGEEEGTVASVLP